MRILVIVVMAALLPSVASAHITWVEHVVDGEFNGATSVYATDVDGDGDIDVLGTARNAPGRIMWWENIHGDGSNWSENLVVDGFIGAWSVFATDVDGDGDTDVLGAAYVGGQLAWWENVSGDGLNWAEHPLDLNIDYAASVYAADVDGDGDCDMLGGAAGYGGLRWWENLDGSGLILAEHIVVGNTRSAWSIHATDMDGDGDCDVLCGEGLNGVAWWENLDGDGLEWSEHPVDQGFWYASIIAIDVDGDGLKDVVGATDYGDDIAWWKNVDGVGLEWAEHTVDSEFDGAESVYAADIDGDGDIDVLGAGKRSDTVEWWENVDGVGLNWTRHLVRDGFTYACWVFAADVDGDDDIDILGAATSADEITWWENALPLPTIKLEPFGAPIVIPGQGGQFDFKVRIVNRSNYPLWLSAWSEAILPNGDLYSPIMLNNYVGIGPYSGFVRVVTQGVPGFAPTGEYQFFARLGMYPYQTTALDSFSFSKGYGVTADPPLADWSVSGFNDVEAATPHELPTEYSVESAHPNPFNSTTTISIALSEASYLTVVVFNVNGQRVAELANDQFNEGSHTLTFDASNLASGLYFIRTTVPGHLEEIQKVMLVR
jgi:FG-GAP-like repeat/Secretion system C-terminal sorting domain